MGHLGIDQYGGKYILGKHPRKDLLEQLFATKAEKMYCDTVTGEIKHVGYIIRGLWISIYKISEWKGVKNV